MKHTSRRVRALVALFAILAALFPGAMPYARTPTASAAVSADPAEEIVYLDNNGFVKIIDTSGSPSLNGWTSPEGGWADIRLADVNADGDLEILAIGRVGNIVKVVVYDPVSSDVTDPNKKHNGIPWDELDRREIPGTAGNFIIGGDFDDAIPGDEFAVGYRVDAGLFSIVIFKAASLQPNGKPSGRDWLVHIRKDYTGNQFEYESAASGQVDGIGAEELVVVGKEIITNPTGQDVNTFFEVLDADNDLERLDGKESDEVGWNKVAVGEVADGDGGRAEVVVIRSASGSSPTIIVYQWDPGDNELVTEDEWVPKLPQPEFVFLSDFFGDGDLEIVTMHKWRDGIEGLRTFDCCGANRSIFQDVDEDDNRGVGPKAYLASDDGYRRGAGGDIDGDGRGEVLVIRDNNIRVFTEPSNGLGGGSIIDFNVLTDRESIQVGDLDKNGFISGPQFGTDRSMIVAQAPIGTVSSEYTVRLSNISTGETVNYFVVGGYPNWIQIQNPSGTFGPSGTLIRFRFNATSLAVGTYNATLQISSPAAVVNKPYNIQIAFTVLPAALNFNGLLAARYPTCPPNVDDLPQTLTAQIRGTQNLNFRAAIIEAPEEGESIDVSKSYSSVVQENGDMVLTDAEGNSTTIASGVGAEMLSASNDVTYTWPIGPSWIESAWSPTTTVPSAITVTVNPVGIGEDFVAKSALLVIVADSRAGSPPDNVRFVSIDALCGDSVIYIPTTGVYILPAR